MRSDQHEGRAGFEADATLDAERGFAHVNVAADAVARREVSKAVHEPRAVYPCAIEGHRKSAIPPDDELGRSRGVRGRLDELGRRAGPCVVGPSPAPGRAPEAAVDAEGTGPGRYRQPACLEKRDRL